MWRAVTTLALISLSVACGGEAPPVGDVSLEIGAGEASGASGFIPLGEPAELTLVPGAQGGFHVMLNMRVAAGTMPAADIRLSRTARRADTDELVSRSEHYIEMIPSESDPELDETKDSFAMFLCPTPVGIQVADEVLELRFEVIDRDGNPAVGTGQIIARCPEGDQQEFCERICFG